MAEHGCYDWKRPKLLEIAETFWIGWKSAEMAGNGWKWMQMDGIGCNGWNLLEIVGNSRK